MWTEGVLNLKANEALEAHRRVKIDTSAATANPPKVVYADAGDDYVGVTLGSAASGEIVAVDPAGRPGSVEIECIIGSAINVGTVLYGSADGMVSDTASGSGQGVSLQKAAASNEHIAVAPWNVKSTTAATVTIADAGNFTTQSSVEAALAEVYQDRKSIHNYIPISLYSLREISSAMAVGNIAANGGLLASDTTPILAALATSTKGCQVVSWAKTVVDAVGFQIALPPDLDTTANLILHGRVATYTGATGGDTPSLTLKSYFNETGAAVSDTMAASGATSTFAEVLGTIAAADVPSGAQTLTCSLTPGTHSSCGWYLSALWLEYKRSILTS